MTKLNTLFSSPIFSITRKFQKLQVCFCKRRKIESYQYSPVNGSQMGPPERNAPVRRRGNENGGSCKPCIDFTKWLPVVFIVAVIAWSYYAFVVQLCVFTMKETWLQVFSLTVYHIVLVLFLWAYWMTVFTNSGRIPKKFKIPDAHMDRIEMATSEPEVTDTLETIVRAQQLPVVTRTHISQIRYCEKCSIVKPDRCHHCSVCGSCILKMDHHCPWVNNCVCFDNYKFFILFLGYAFLYCLVIFAFSLRYFIDFWSGDWDVPLGGRFHVLFVFFVAAMFAVSLVSLFSYHLFLISKNQSTLESFRSPIFRDGPDKQGFSLGCYYNFVEVFGDDRKKWCLPIFTSMGDGITYPTRHSPSGPGGNYNSIDTTDTTTPGSGDSPADYGQCVEVKVEARTENFSNELNSNATSNGRNNHQANATSLEVKETPLVYF